jgi:hypothetical protein
MPVDADFPLVFPFFFIEGEAESEIYVLQIVKDGKWIDVIGTKGNVNIRD